MIIRLQKSIDNLYAVFATYKGNTRMSGSPFIGGWNERNSKLYSKPLSELNEDDLSEYSMRAITTWGEVEDYKHFLPRIFELIATYNEPHDIWISFEKLEYANWSKWSLQEQEAIHEYMIALFENLLNDESNPAELHFTDYFTSIAHFYPKCESLLKLWDSINTKISFKYFSKFMTEQSISIFEKGVISGFKDSDKNVKEIINWLLRKEIKEKIEQAFFKYEYEDFAEELSMAEKTIDNQIRIKAKNNS